MKKWIIIAMIVLMAPPAFGAGEQFFRNGIWVYDDVGAYFGLGKGLVYRI